MLDKMNTDELDSTWRRGRSIPIAFLLWVIYFCYAICAALVFQKVLVPLVPSLHAIGGLVGDDAIYFDSVAVKMAEQINLNGWGGWQLYPAQGAAGNVGILAALYAIFGHDPTLILPVNASIHALGGVLIFLLARELANKDSVGVLAGIIAGSLFVLFPSSLNWYGQLHKDGYAIAGFLLILLVWIKALCRSGNEVVWVKLFLAHLAGVVLIALVRPYNLKLMLVAYLVGWVLWTFIAILRRRAGFDLKFNTFLIVSAAVCIGGIGAAGYLGADSNSEQAYASFNGTGKPWKWQDTPWVPDKVEHYVELAAQTRGYLIDYGISQNAKSMIDVDVKPQSIVEVVGYLPRALQISLFAPLPNTWFQSLSLMRLTAVAETLIFYICFVGLLLLFLYERKPATWVTLYFATFMMTVVGFTIANMGTLYRIRYAYQFVFLMLGVLGWITWLDQSGRLQRFKQWLNLSTISASAAAKENNSIRRKEVLGSGVIVMALTLFCFVGFFVRDIMMAHTFGLGASLDNFFIALLIPMFVVTVLGLPLGAVFVPTYLEKRERDSEASAKTFVTSTTTWISMALFIVCIALYLTGPALFPLLGLKSANQNLTELTKLFDLALPILLFSGLVIMGNAVLNAKGRAVLTSSAQLVVPVSAIVALVFFGKEYGIKSVMYGMVVGQLLNLAVIQYYLKRQQVSLWPAGRYLNAKKWLSDGGSSLLAQYVPLIVSAFFISAAAPVATVLAMSLPEGAVSAFNLGNKVVLFVTSLVGTAVSTVMLPYFSAMVSKNNIISARRELSLFLLFATFITIPCSAIIYFWAAPIVHYIFEGGVMGGDAVSEVTRVMQFSIVQLPFFVCNALLLKFATATKHVLAISVVAFVGMVVSIIASMILMRHMGVAGIALGMTVSMLLSTILLVLVLVRYGHITGLDALVMLLNWFLYITLLICIHYASTPSIVVSLMAYATLLVGYANMLLNERRLGIRDLR